MHAVTADEPLNDHDLVIRHDEQISVLDKTVAEIKEHNKWMLRLMISTLLAAVGGFLTQLLKH